MQEVGDQIFCLNAHYSTTRRVINIPPEIRNSPGVKFDRMLVVLPHPRQKEAGGLRTQGYFKVNGGQSEDSQGNNRADGHALITVITAVFNGIDTIEQSILSVINQSYDNIEYIVIDGGSSDGTVEVIRNYAAAIDYWVTEPDEGIYDAWNKGVRLASGDWLAFLGGDDVYLAGAMQAYAGTIARYRDQSLEYISSRVNLTTGSQVRRTIGRRWNWNSFKRNMNIAHVGSLHSRSLFEKYGLFDISYKIGGDYEFLLRAGSDLRAAYMPSVTVNMGIGGASDNNLLGFREKARAKITTGGQNRLMSHIERLVAVGKWKLRRWLWY
jgi:glycosyltransferase involved in cell wall biosynthesis